MSTWIYESHLGGLFTSPHRLPIEECYCETCGDYDWEIGGFDSFADFIASYADNIEVIPGEGGYTITAAMRDVGCAFAEKPTLKQLKKIAFINRHIKRRRAKNKS